MSINEILYKFYEKLPSVTLQKKVLDIIKIFISLKEFNLKIKNKNKNLTLVYDSYNASNRYGDFIYFCMLARILIIKGHKLQIIFLKDCDSNNEILLCDLIKILKIFLKDVNYKFEEMNLQKFNDTSDKFQNIIFEKLVKYGAKSYLFYYQLITHIYKNDFSRNNDKFFINEDILGNPCVNKKNSLNNRKYICLICRYADGDDISRDLTEDEFLNLRKYLKRRFEDIPIVVVSDNKGCNYYKSVEPDDGIKLIYSKDLFNEDDYLKDASLVLSSSLVIQIRGGGITIPTIFSKTPYFLCWKNVGIESITNKRKLTPWSIELKNQFFYRTNNWNEKLFIKHKFINKKY